MHTHIQAYMYTYTCMCGHAYTLRGAGPMCSARRAAGPGPGGPGWDPGLAERMGLAQARAHVRYMHLLSVCMYMCICRHGYVYIYIQFAARRAATVPSAAGPETSDVFFSSVRFIAFNFEVHGAPFWHPREPLWHYFAAPRLSLVPLWSFLAVGSN